MTEKEPLHIKQKIEAESGATVKYVQQIAGVGDKVGV